MCKVWRVLSDLEVGWSPWITPLVVAQRGAAAAAAQGSDYGTAEERQKRECSRQVTAAERRRFDFPSTLSSGMQLPVLVEITRFTNYEPQSYYIMRRCPVLLKRQNV